MYFKSIVVIFFALTLVGCQSTPKKKKDTSQPLVKEIIYKTTKRFSHLIELYKKQLSKKDTPEVRKKLAQVYLDNNDPESAISIIFPLNRTKPTVESLLMQANAELNLKKPAVAIKTLYIALKKDSKNAKIENLLGIAYVNLGQLAQARKFFNQARTHLYDDVKIKNNLAVLDIIQGNYSKAVNTLIALFQDNKKDQQIRANLLLALAKEERFDDMVSLFSGRLSKAVIKKRYLALKNLESQNVFGKRYVLPKSRKKTKTAKKKSTKKVATKKKTKKKSDKKKDSKAKSYAIKKQVTIQ